jgi:outer membrane murein-binding lipoprotein Lpp
VASRKLDELATDIDDASTVVEELQDDLQNELQETPAADAGAKIDELRDTLEHASDTIDDVENDNE